MNDVEAHACLHPTSVVLLRLWSKLLHICSCILCACALLAAHLMSMFDCIVIVRHHMLFVQAFHFLHMSAAAVHV